MTEPFLRLLAVALVAITTEASAAPRRGVPSAPDLSSEARITQARPTRNAPARPIQEPTAASSGVVGSAAPATCNDSNASSPACYTATQQARPVTR